MSIHRPKRPTHRRTEGAAATRSAQATPAPKQLKWKEVVGSQPDAAFAPYSPAATFAKDALVSHAKFGKGIVVEVDGNKIQILFEEGQKKLLHATPGA
jgi:hypothetical protein